MIDFNDEKITEQEKQDFLTQQIDPEYKKIVEQYAEAEKELVKARYKYNNIDRYVSLKQSELKRDLALTNKV